jgi:cytoskeletal protein RodZ
MMTLKYLAILLVIGTIYTQTTTTATTTTPTTTTPTTTTTTTTTPTTTTTTPTTTTTTTPTTTTNTNTTATTTTTTTPTNTSQGMNTCGTVGANEPKALGDCTSDKSIPNYTCCLLTFKDPTGTSRNKCDATVTAGLVGDYKSVVKSIIEASKMTYVDYQCAASYLTVSFIIFFITALLF